MVLKPRTLYLIHLLFLSVIGYGQTKSLLEQPVDLEKFNFNTKIEVLIPKEYRDESDTDYESYRFTTRNRTPNSFTKRPLFIDENNPEKGIHGFEFYQSISATTDTLAVFKNYTFNKIDFALDKNNQIYVVCGVAGEITKKERNDCITLLTRKYGPYKKYKGKSAKNLSIYEWQLKDKIIRYSSVLNSENNFVKQLATDEDNSDPIVQEPHYESYLYLIKKQKIKDIKILETGGLNFID